MSTPACQIYLLTPPRLDDAAAFAPLLARALDAGSVPCVQLRLKQTDDDAIRYAADLLRPVCHERDVALVMNDRPDLARDTGCDGVHLGEDDATLQDARALLGAGAIIGVSCYDSRHRAMELADQGADYVAFGAFFPTRTKQAKTRVGPDILADWSTFTTVPCVAIGGITPHNARPLIEAGADFLAVSGAVWHHADGPAAAIAEFTALLSLQD